MTSIQHSWDGSMRNAVLISQHPFSLVSSLALHSVIEVMRASHMILHRSWTRVTARMTNGASSMMLRVVRKMRWTAIWWQMMPMQPGISWSIFGHMPDRHVSCHQKLIHCFCFSHVFLISVCQLITPWCSVMWWFLQSAFNHCLEEIPQSGFYQSLLTDVMQVAGLQQLMILSTSGHPAAVIAGRNVQAESWCELGHLFGNWSLVMPASNHQWCNGTQQNLVLFLFSNHNGVRDTVHSTESCYSGSVLVAWSGEESQLPPWKGCGHQVLDASEVEGDREIESWQTQAPFWTWLVLHLHRVQSRWPEDWWVVRCSSGFGQPMGMRSFIQCQVMSSELFKLPRSIPLLPKLLNFIQGMQCFVLVPMFWAVRLTVCHNSLLRKFRPFWTPTSRRTTWCCPPVVMGRACLPRSPFRRVRWSWEQQLCCSRRRPRWWRSSGFMENIKMLASRSLESWWKGSRRHCYFAWLIQWYSMNVLAPQSIEFTSILLLFISNHCWGLAQ